MSLTFEVYRGSYVLRYRRHAISHRIIGPAALWEDGGMSWCEYGIPHRLDGPSDVGELGAMTYYIRGIRYSKDLYELKIRS